MKAFCSAKNDSGFLQEINYFKMQTVKKNNP